MLLEREESQNEKKKKYIFRIFYQAFIFLFYAILGVKVRERDKDFEKKLSKRKHRLRRRDIKIDRVSDRFFFLTPIDRRKS